MDTGLEGLGRRLINSKEGTVKFDKVEMNFDVLMTYGQALVEEQDNVKRVQLAESYMSAADLAGSSGSSLPEAYKDA